MSQTPEERRASGIAIPGEFISVTADGSTEVHSEDEFIEQWTPVGG